MEKLTIPIHELQYTLNLEASEMRRSFGRVNSRVTKYLKNIRTYKSYRKTSQIIRDLTAHIYNAQLELDKIYEEQFNELTKETK